MLNDQEKIKILDAILANHGAIIQLWGRNKKAARMAERMGVVSPPCGCDPDVGFFCEECALENLMSHLYGVLDSHYSEGRTRARLPTPGL